MWLCDPNRRAETLLRLVGRDYHIGGAGSPTGDKVLRRLERAVELAPGPRTYLALGIARCARAITDTAPDELRAVEAALGPSAPAGVPTEGSLPPVRGGAPAAAVAGLLAPPAGAAGEAELARVLDYEPGNTAAHLYLGGLLLWRGDPGAENHLRAAAASDPANALPHYMRAYLRTADGDAPGALEAIEEGNARPECAMPVSPAIEAVKGERFHQDDGLPVKLAFLLTAPAFLLVGPNGGPGALDAGSAPPDADPPYAQRLAQQGQVPEAYRVCDAVQEMGRKLAGAKPLEFFKIILGAGLMGNALAAGERVARDAGDAAVGSRAAAQRQELIRAQSLRKEHMERSLRNWSKEAWREFAWKSGAETAVKLAALLLVLLAFILRHPLPGTGIPLLGLALVAFLTAGVLSWRGVVLPARWFPDPERAMMERYLAMLPPARDAAARPKDG